MVTPSRCAARASEVSVRTTPLTCGYQASVATNTFIEGVSPEAVPAFSIRMRYHCDWMSQLCDEVELSVINF